jgi:sialate O-acetylesterase
VWLISGQSNMAMGIGKSKDAAAIKAKSVDPKLRFCFVPVRGATEPMRDVECRWMEAGEYSTHMMSAVGYFFGRDLRAARPDVPIGLINASVGGTYADTWIPRKHLDADPALKPVFERWENQLKAYETILNRYKQEEPELLRKWEEEAAKARAAGQKEPPRPQSPQDPLTDPRNRPGNQYNGVIAGIQPYAIRGAAWYQGENDAGQAQYYRTSLGAMVRSWRETWGQGDFPFMVVQLPAYGNIDKDPPVRSAWSETRETQAWVARTQPNAWTVSSIDCGDEAIPTNLHPPRKEPIGQRLALLARAKVYGEKIECSAPELDKAAFEGDKATLTFTHLCGGLEARGGGELKGFTICGEDRKFVNAQARIQGDTIVVSSPEVPKPVAVRYAWADFPVCNLVNKLGLPTSSFRTDDFPFTGSKGK